MDKIVKELRSWNMARIKNKNTKPERIVRSLLHRLGYRFRLHCAGLPGSPDIVLRRYSTAIFVHGCFWHRHRGCKYAYSPKSRVAFWKRKFSKNVARDLEVCQMLAEMDWSVEVVWECETRNAKALEKKVRSIGRRMEDRKVR